MNSLTNISFAHPWFLLLLILIPVLIFWKWYRAGNQTADLKLSTTDSVGGFSIKAAIKNILGWLKIGAIAFLIIALARPQDMLNEEKVTTEGIDIVIAMDISGSMLARDFQPDRLGAAKNTAMEFVGSRTDDRIGLVVFAGESFTQCPVTTDHAVLKELASKIKSGAIEDGTAIGMGLATAVNRLKDQPSESKVIILLTDGVNNKGFIDPVTAAETAKEYGIKVYTIGVGSQGTAPYPYRDVFGRTALQNIAVEIDETLLEQIAEKTGGQYFRATNNNSLRNIYAEIDQLEKTEIEVSSIRRYTEEFHLWAFIAGVLLLIPLLLNFTFLRSIT